MAGITIVLGCTAYLVMVTQGTATIIHEVTGLPFYATLFDGDPTKLEAVVGDLSGEEHKLLQKIAKAVSEKRKRSLSSPGSSPMDSSE